MGINMVELGKACMYFKHKNRKEYYIGKEKERVEICDDCIESALESLKIDAGWYNPYDE